MTLYEADKKMLKLLDGGLATEIVRNGFEFIDQDPLWSARLLKTEPSAIKNAHLSFLRAGAEVLITASYQASVDGFQKYANLNEAEAEKLIGDSVVLAKEAIEEFLTTSGRKNKPLVAGSVGPYGACLHDSSEYTGSYIDKISKEELINWHRKRMEILIAAGVDILAIESIPAQTEAEALVELLKEFPNVKAWVTYTCKDRHCISHGEKVSEAVKAVMDSEQIFGVGFNCTSPEYIESLLKQIQFALGKKTIVVYPNSGETWMEEKSWHKSSKLIPLHEYVPIWLSLGATWIGGCCRTTPDDISMIKQTISATKSGQH